MDPVQFSRLYRFDPRIVDGSFFSSNALDIDPGDTIGVVLLNLGGPKRTADVKPFLYNLFMDPAIIDIPLRGQLRHLVSSLISSTRSKKVAHDYAAISEEGGSPINPLTEVQATLLESELNERIVGNDVTFKTYVAMRYWHPLTEEAAAQMKKDGVDKVVLLPLYPHYSKTTTGASLVYWHTLQEMGGIETRPTTYVKEYAAHPDYLRSLSDRIDEGLERFPESRRDSVELLFSAHGTPVKEMTERKDPYCCLIHSTVDQLMKRRRMDRSFHVAFQSKVGPATWFTPSTQDKLKELAEGGTKSVLVIPIAFVTDHIETAYELDIEIRNEAKELGIHEYEVTSGLNDHPRFIAALTDVVMRQLRLPGSDREQSTPWPDLGTYEPHERNVRCDICEKIAEACVWS